MSPEQFEIRVEPIQVLKNGAKYARIPLENQWNPFHLRADIIEHVAPISFDEAKAAAIKVGA